jgi:hypothetical protein
MSEKSINVLTYHHHKLKILFNISAKTRVLIIVGRILHNNSSSSGGAGRGSSDSSSRQ